MACWRCPLRQKLHVFVSFTTDTESSKQVNSPIPISWASVLEPSTLAQASIIPLPVFCWFSGPNLNPELRKKCIYHVPGAISDSGGGPSAASRNK